jgi:ABC-type amino acid transport substrate-binding protein
MCFHKSYHKPFQKRCCEIGAIALTLFISFQAFAAEPLRIATVSSPMIGFLSDDGQPTGLYYEIGNLIAKTAGLEYTNEVMPFIRILKGLENGDVDFGMIFLRDQNPKLVPVHFVTDSRAIVIGRKGTRFESLADLHGKVVAQIRGASFDKAFDQDQAIEKYDVADSAQWPTMLMHGRFDAYIGPEVPTMYEDLWRLGYTRDDFGEPLVLNTRQVWAHVSAATVDEATAAALSGAIETLLAEGKIQQLFEKYLEQ